MSQGKLPIIAVICAYILHYPTHSQSILKYTQNEVEPIEKFTFLVDSNIVRVASTVRLEQFDILIGIDFSYEQWKIMLGMMDLILEEFPKFEFFKDAELKDQFAGACLLGQDKFNQFHRHVDEILKFKNENINDTSVNLCSETPIEITYKGLERELRNLKNRYNFIKPTWTVQDVKTKSEIQGIILDFCFYFNDFAISHELLTSEMLTALEELSDNVYPEVLFGEEIRNCTYSSKGDGEQYHVIRCERNNKGYRCQIEVTQAINLKEYIRAYPIHYEEVTLMGYEPSDIFGRTIDSRELKYLDCSDEHSGDYAVCVERDVPDHCKSALSADNIANVIRYCNFTKEIAPIGLTLPHGGVLVQGEGVTIKNGENSLKQVPPIVIYSPDTVTLNFDEEDYVFPPAIQINKLVVIESRLTTAEIEKLLGEYEWQNFWEHVETDDYIRYALVLLQIIIFPMALFGCYVTLSQRKLIRKIIQTPKHRRKENFKNNQQILRGI
jgi:hypothetical protein